MDGDANGAFRVLCAVIVVMERFPQEGEKEETNEDE
jgi:hypothetical protein